MWLPFESNERKIYRKMGYYSDQEGIYHRYSMEVENWKPHLEKTKSFIINSAAKKGNKKAAILGSGWLLDLPILELCDYFEEVWLFDIRHPAQISHKINKLRNVTPFITDISGFTIPIYQATIASDKAGSKIDWKQLTPKFDFRIDEFDFVVSCNLLDQLDTIPVDFLLKQNLIKSEEITALRTKIQQTHINILPPSKSCIITDFEEIMVNQLDQVTTVKKVAHINIPSADKLDTWIWKFDNHSTYYADYKTWFKVVAFEL